MATEIRKRAQFHRSGGSQTLVIPKAWLEQIGVGEEDKVVTLVLKEGKISIEKAQYGIDEKIYKELDKILNGIDGQKLSHLNRYFLDNIGGLEKMRALNDEAFEAGLKHNALGAYFQAREYLKAEMHQRASWSGSDWSLDLMTLVSWAAVGVVSKSWMPRASKLSLPLRNVISGKAPFEERVEKNQK